MAAENTISSKRRIAIVTGGSRGLGRSTVLDLAKRGVDTIITYNANREAAEQVVAAARELPNVYRGRLVAFVRKCAETMS